MPSESVLTAFSLVLGVPREALREAARVPSGEPEPFVLSESANWLNARQRELILHTVRSLLNE